MAITEVKVTLLGREEPRYGTEALVYQPPDRATLMWRTLTQWTSEEPLVHVPADSWTIAYYWADTPYHAYQWISRRGLTIGVSFAVHHNISITVGAVRFVSLEAVYWVGSDGAVGWINTADAIELGVESRRILDIARADLERRGSRLAESLIATTANLLTNRDLT